MADIGDDFETIVLGQGWLSAHAIESSQIKAKDEGHADFGEYLVKENLLTQVQRAEALAIQNGMEFVGGRVLVGAPEATDLVSLEFARSRTVLPLRVEDGSLYAVIADPMDLSLMDDLSFMAAMPIVCYVGAPVDIQKGIANSYSGGDELNSLIDASETVNILEGESEEDVDEGDAPVIALVNMIIGNAVKKVPVIFILNRWSPISEFAIELTANVRWWTDQINVCRVPCLAV